MTAVFTIIEIIGVISFAIAGAIEAINKESDLFGVVFLAIITTFGGGMIRDVMLNQIPVFFTSYLLVAVCFVTAILVFIVAAIFKNNFVKNEKLIGKINNILYYFNINNNKFTDDRDKFHYHRTFPFPQTGRQALQEQPHLRQEKALD